MNRQTPFILILLISYICFPALFGWVTAPEGLWFKPYIVWIIVIIAAYIFSTKSPKHDP